MNNTGLENISSEIPEEKINHEIVLNGSWENKGRSITAAAVTGLIGIGAIYFNVQSILVMIFVAISRSIYNIDLPDDFIESIKTITRELKTPVLTALTISQYLFMLVPTLWIVKKWHTTDVKKYLRIQLCSFKEIMLAVLITVALLPFCYFLSYIILDLFKIPEVFRNLGEDLFAAHSIGELITLIFVVAITPAICEEVFFRGYFQRTLERNLGAKSFIITGVLFGLFHMQPLGLITLSILGILFSFFYYRSKSLFPSSAAHFTNNLIAILLLYLQTQSPGKSSQYDGNVPLGWVVLSLLIAIGLFIVYLNITKGRSANS